MIRLTKIRMKFVLGSIAIGGAYFYIRNKSDEYDSEQREKKAIMDCIHKGQLNKVLIDASCKGKKCSNMGMNHIRRRMNNVILFKMMYHTMMEKFMDKVVFRLYDNGINTQCAYDLIDKAKSKIKSLHKH